MSPFLYLEEKKRCLKIGLIYKTVMRKLTLILILVWFTPIALAQGNMDSIRINQIKKEKLYQIEQWENQIESARKNGDLSTEMNVMMELISVELNDFADYSSAYEDMRYLEKLVANNPNEPAIIQIEAQLNVFLGWILNDQDNLEEALYHYEKALMLAKKYNKTEFYKKVSCDRAQLLARIGRREEGVNYLRKLEKEAILSKDSIFRNRFYEVMATFYFNEKKIDSSLFYSKKSIDDFSPSNQRVFRLILVGRCFFILEKEMDSVIYYGEKGLKIALESGLEKEQKYAYDLLRETYHKLGNDKKAYYYFEKFYQLEQKQKSFGNALRIGKINLQSERQEASIRQALASQKLSNQRLIIWIVSITLLLLAIGLFYIFNRLRLIQSQNKIIAQEKLRAEQSERYKEQFLANMSHEIRTPMHAISGMLNSLRRQPHPESQNDFLNAMKISADNLLVLLNDVLDMSKIESGNLDIEQVNMSAKVSLEQVVAVCKYKAEEKGLELKMNISPDFPDTIIGDPDRLHQILMNLLSNAIKFTEKGYVEINLSQKDDNLRFTIKDTGIGISSNQKELIFDSFKQGKSKSKGKFGGTGLGLTISKQLIELQGGKMWVESEEDKGSIFYVELPLIVGEKTEATEKLVGVPELKSLGNALKGLRVLVAEDNEFNVMVIKDDLTWYIPEVKMTFAENGKLAFETFKKFDFDIILMDVQMPEVDGYKATRKIRKFEKDNNIIKPIAIVAMTASLLKNQIDKCYKAGMDAYIPKPYKAEELINTLIKVTQGV